MKYWKRFNDNINFKWFVDDVADSYDSNELCEGQFYSWNNLDLDAMFRYMNGRR